MTPQTDPDFIRGVTLAAYGACANCHFNNWHDVKAIVAYLSSLD